MKRFLTILILSFIISISGCGLFERQVEPFPSLSPIITPTASPSETVPIVTETAELGILTIHYIDVGQGDCTLIDYGDTEILIDTGKKGAMDLNYISPLINGDLEVVVATHPDADHIGDMELIFDTFNVQGVVDSGEVKITQTYARYETARNEEPDCSRYYLKRDEVFYIGGLEFLVLNPETGSTDDYNGNSIALLLQFGEVNFYFMADVEEDQEKEIIEYFDLPKAHYLKAGHHGSKTSSSEEFLDEIMPSVVIYSAGRDNSYGHPHQEAIDRWIDHGASFLGTDATGDIIVTSDGTLEGTEISTEY